MDAAPAPTPVEPSARVRSAALGKGTGRPAAALSPPALEVLGALAACTWSGPHRALPLRRWTRLTPAAFEDALVELARDGLVLLERGDLFWVTESGEDRTRQLFN